MQEKYSYRNNTTQSTNKWIDEGKNVVLFEVKHPWFENIISKEDTHKQKQEQKSINTNSNILANKIINKKYKFNSKCTIACIIIIIIFILVCIRIYKKKKIYHK